MSSRCARKGAPRSSSATCSSATCGSARVNRTWCCRWIARSGDAPGKEPWSAAVDASWKRVPAFGPWENWAGAGLEQFNGMVWYRTSVNLGAEQAARAARLALGAIDDVDETFVNGVPVGNNANSGEQREYSLPRGALRAGANTIAV